MRTLLTSTFGIICLWASIETQALGQTPSEQCCSLETLLSQTLEKNPDLEISQIEIVAARGEARIAKTWQNPELSVGPSLRRIPATAEENGNSSFKGTLELGQLIEFPGKRAIRQALAEQNIQTKEMATTAWKQQLRVAVKREFYSALAAQELRELRDSQAQAARLFVDLTEKRSASGYASEIETVRARAELIAAMKLRKEAEASLALSLITLNQLRGEPAHAPLRLVGSLEALPKIQLSERQTEEALLHNPSLQLQRASADRSGLLVEASHLERKPDVVAGPFVEYTSDEQIYGLGISVPLPLWDQKRGEIQVAKAEQRKALAELRKTELEVQSQTLAASQKVKATQEELALFSPEFRSQLKRAMTAAEANYSEGKASALLYLDAKRTYFDSLASYYETLLELAQAQLDLESALGQPLSETNTTR